MAFQAKLPKPLCFLKSLRSYSMVMKPSKMSIKPALQNRITKNI